MPWQKYSNVFFIQAESQTLIRAYNLCKYSDNAVPLISKRVLNLINSPQTHMKAHKPTGKRKKKSKGEGELLSQQVICFDFVWCLLPVLCGAL